MSNEPNTLLLRLAGPMQSWGTSSRFQLRRTDRIPSKSGVLGLLLCAKGVSREASREALAPLSSLHMGVRVDRPGSLDWDYHTAGAKIGIRQAKGGIKYTTTTKEPETLLSRRQYLLDASFLVALQGDPGTIEQCTQTLENPVWPVFLGRKCCIPSEPVFRDREYNLGSFTDLAEALASREFEPRISGLDKAAWGGTRTLETWIECPTGMPPEPGARLVHDVPRGFGFNNQGARFVTKGQVTVRVGKETQPPPPRPHYVEPYGREWESHRKARLERDHYLCVFCKEPASDVHHLDYDDVRTETLRSLCKACHDACTMLEYGHDMTRRRIDPCEPEYRPLLLEQLARNRQIARRSRRRWEITEKIRSDNDFFHNPPSA